MYTEHLRLKAVQIMDLWDLRKCVSTSTPNSNFSRKANQKASGSTMIGSLYGESRTWLIVETKLCVCCVERVHVDVVKR